MSGRWPRRRLESGPVEERVRIVTCSGGAPWEPRLAAALSGGRRGVRLLRSCLDHGELLGVALRERPTAAVLGGGLRWLDRELVGALQQAGVATVVVEGAGPRPRADRLGALAHLPAHAGPDEILATVLSLRSDEVTAPSPARSGSGGRVVAVWGAAGAPGRTTVAVHLAASLSRDRSTVLVDGDAWAPSVAQEIGLEAFPSLARAARLANEGWPEPLGHCLQQGPAGVRVLAGLARPGSWLQVRQRAWRGVLDACRQQASCTVVDLASAVEEDEELSFDEAPFRRNTMTRTALEECDRLVFVVRADPVGVRRAVLAWRDVEELVPGVSSHTVLVMNAAPGPGSRRRVLATELESQIGLSPRSWLPQEPALGAARWSGGLLHEVAPRSPWLRRMRDLADEVAG